MVKRRFNLLKVIIAVCVLALSLSIASAFAVKNKTVSADAYGPTPVTGTLKMVAGVSIKMTGNGLRYRVMIDAETWVDDIKDEDSVSLGILIFPTQYLEGDPTITGHYHAALDDQTSHATYGTFAAQDITVDKGKVYISMINDNQYYCANGVLTNIQTNHRDLEYTAVGYTYNGSTYTYADENSAKCLHEALSCLYFDPNAEDRALYRSALASYYSTNTWLGTAAYPYIIDTSKNLNYYNAVVASVAAGETFSGKYFYITNDATADSVTNLIGHNGSYTFAGTFVQGSGLVKAPDGSSYVNNFNFAQSAQEILIGGVETQGAGGTEAAGDGDGVYEGSYYFGYGVEWQNVADDSSGEKGVVKLTWPSSSNTWPWFTFLPNNPVSDYTDTSKYNQIRIRMKLESAKGFYFWVMANDTQRRSCCLNENFVTLGAWADYYFDIDAFTHYWGAMGDYSVARVWAESQYTGAGVLYISEIQAVKDEWVCPATNDDEIRHIRGFELDEMSMTNATNETYSLSRGDRPAGATHGSVAYRKAKASTVTFKMTSKQTEDKFYDYSLVRFRIRFAGVAAGDSTTVTITPYPGSGTAGFKLPIITLTAGSWTAFDLNLSYLYGRFSDATGSGGWFTAAGDFTEVYIYSVTVVKDAADADGKLLNTKYATDATKQNNIIDRVYTSGTAAKWNATAGFYESGYSGYIGLSSVSGGSQTSFSLGLKPTCTFNEFKEYDYIEFRIRNGNSNSEETITMKFHDRVIGTLPYTNAWTTVSMPIWYFYDTKTPSAVYNNIREFFFWLNGSFVFNFTTSSQRFWVYIEDISLTKDGNSHAYDATGDNFANLEVANFSITGNATPQKGTYQGKTAIKLNSNDTWANVYVKSGLSVGKFYGHTHLKINLYIDASSQPQIYEQNAYTGGNVAYYYTTTKVDTPPTAGDYSHDKIPINDWVDIYLPLKHLGKVWSFHTTNNPVALFIFRGVGFNNLYISSITLD